MYLTPGACTSHRGACSSIEATKHMESTETSVSFCEVNTPYKGKSPLLRFALNLIQFSLTTGFVIILKSDVFTFNFWVFFFFSFSVFYVKGVFKVAEDTLQLHFSSMSYYLIRQLPHGRF